jgi:hypothetical protein
LPWFSRPTTKSKKQAAKIHDTWKSFIYYANNHNDYGQLSCFLFLANFHILWRHTHPKKKKTKKQKEKKLVLLQNRYEGFSWGEKKKSQNCRHIIVKGIFFGGNLPYL